MSEHGVPYKLHLGCGKVRLEGWINVDGDTKATAADVRWDLTTPLPFPKNTCALIYHEHLLEHLPVKEGVSLLKECYHLLQPDGVLRVAMPSLDELIERAYKGTWREMDWISWPEHRFIKTRAEMVNIAFRWWGHQWLYDREELHRRLEEAGFSKIKDVAWGQSDVPELRDRETRKDTGLICEARK